MSSESFNRALVQRLLDLLWSLWQELGVLGRARPSPWAADPEALLLWTSWFGAADRRLEDAALEWVAEFEDLVNTSRLKIMYRSGVPCDPAALQRWFPKSDAAGAGTRWRAVTAWLLNQRRSEANRPPLLPSDPGTTPATEPGTPPQTGQATSALSERRIGKRSKLRPRNAVLRSSPAIRFRLLFGVTTRAEVGRFLAGGGSGNSNSIAREICLSQRGVFETLRDLEAVELVEARREGRAKVYTAAQGLLHFAAASGKTFFNWANYSSAIAEALRALERWPQAQSEYQRNSLITTAKERFFERLEKSSWNRRFFRRQPDLGRGPEHLDHFLPSHPFGAGSA